MTDWREEKRDECTLHLLCLACSSSGANLYDVYDGSHYRYEDMVHDDVAADWNQRQSVGSRRIPRRSCGRFMGQ